MVFNGASKLRISAPMRWILIIPGLAVFLADIGVANASATPSVGHDELSNIAIADPVHRFYWPVENWCGVIAAYLISNDLGDVVGLTDVASELGISSEGTAMSSLEHFFSCRGHRVRAIRVSAQSLCDALRRDPGLRAVAFVADRHWLAVFSAGDRGVIAFDYPNWIQLTNQEFAETFQGKALVIGSDQAEFGRILYIWPNIVLVILLSVSLVLLWMKLKCRPNRVELVGV